MDKQKVAVFDSGLGGLTVLHEIRKELPAADLVFFGDSANNPYGTKSRRQIRDRCVEICDWLVSLDVACIVVACNTATSAAVNELRARYSIPIVGMEPALKPAVETGLSRIAVWATDFTLKEEKFANLLARFEMDRDIVKVPCPDLVRLVEEDRLDQQEAVDAALRDCLERSKGAEVIVLGCTHFPFFKKRLAQLAPDVRLVDGNAGTAHHVREVLQKDLAPGNGTIEWYNSLPESDILQRRLYAMMEDQV